MSIKDNTFNNINSFTFIRNIQQNQMLYSLV